MPENSNANRNVGNGKSRPAVTEEGQNVHQLDGVFIETCENRVHLAERISIRGAKRRVPETFAPRSILSETDVTILQEILAHSEIGTTMLYVKIAEHYKVEAVVKLEQYRA